MKVIDIAEKYGYNSTSLTRALKEYYGQSSREIKKRKEDIPDNRLKIEDYPKRRSRLCFIVEKFIRSEEENSLYLEKGSMHSEKDLTRLEWDYFNGFLRVVEEFKLDWSACLLLANISELFNIPFYQLANYCVETSIDFNKDRELTPRQEYAVDIGISNDQELLDICKYFKCEYYELTKSDIEKYRNNKKTGE